MQDYINLLTNTTTQIVDNSQINLVPDDIISYLKTVCKILPYNYQLNELYKMIECDNNKYYGISGGILSMYMGLGKSITSLCHLLIRKKYFKNSEAELTPNGVFKSIKDTATRGEPENNKCSLIICNNCMISGWQKEIYKFIKNNKIKYIIFHKDYTKNLNDLCNLNDYDLVITTYDMIMKYSKEYKLINNNIIYNENGKKIGIDNCKMPTFKGKGFKLLFSTNWDTIYLDESHKISNPQSVIFNSVMTLYSNIKWCLTGTPIRNYSPDLFTQFRFLGYECVDVHDFCLSQYNKHKLYNRILFKKYTDVDVKAEIILPECIEHIEYLEFNSYEKQLYNYYKTHSKLVYKDYLSGHCNYINIFSMITKLRQISICGYTINKNILTTQINETLSDEIYKNIPYNLKNLLNDINSSLGLFCSKIVRTIEIINEYPNDKFLIFANFKNVFNVLKLAIKEFTNKKVSVLTGDIKGKNNRNNAIENFKDGDADVFLINQKIGGESLTLVEANHVILLEYWWNDATHAQCIARANRVGQTKNVHIWKLFMKDSIEQDILNICNKKNVLSNEFLNQGLETENISNKDIINQLIK
jgi:SNF2 family DNA or RNA helicase